MTNPDLAMGIVVWETTVAAFLLKSRRLLPVKRLVVTEATVFFLDTD